MELVPQMVFVSHAGPFEMEHSDQIVEQGSVRPDCSTRS